MIRTPDPGLFARLTSEQVLWLFLDYDGTLADFAPTPDIVLPDERLIALISSLATVEQNRVTIISGRRLTHMRTLLPIPGILMAGSYGLELQMPDGRIVHRLPQAAIRPILEQVKHAWRALLAGRAGFFLEDKGWTLAIHAKDADEEEAAYVLREARSLANPGLLQSDNGLRLQGGHRFLEIAPVLADKRRSVEYLMQLSSQPGALPLYFGDDDKDEVAFKAVQDRGGLAFAVGDRLLNSSADYHLPSPKATRQWLAKLFESQTGGQGSREATG